MTLPLGTRLGPYEIVSPLGAGGMGEVYRARDTRLDREVAIKVLPSHLSNNTEFRQRFEREAKAISQLSHPHICALYDVGSHEGTEYLVMELLEGQTLSDRLEKGPLPTEQVLKFGIEIADALDKAHRQGIVHRDLKPGNIMLTRSGVKLLDFGLAKLRPSTAEREISQLSSLATEHSPSRPLTERGTLLGTFQYMAPEQLEGKDADARTDIFAFGCVLYEMATGKRAFAGSSRASLVGAIMNTEPQSISSISPMTPPALDRVVKSCLAKDPEDRWQSARDVMSELAWIAEAGSQAGAPAVVASRRRSRETLAWSTSIGLLLAAVALAIGYVRRAPAPVSPVRFELVLPDTLTVVETPRISPDGKLLAFTAHGADGKAQIWLRPLAALDPLPVPGTEGASYRPIWAPDSRHIAFVADGKLKKVALSGGPPEVICAATSAADGSWGEDGTILFDGQETDPIRRVSSAGGVPQAVVKAEGATSIGWPNFLPDGKHFLYFETTLGTHRGRLMVASLDSKEKPKKIIDSDSLAQYAPPGDLLYVKDGTLVAQPFDASADKLTGEPIPIANQMGLSASGLAEFSVSANGLLVYREGMTNQSRLVWIDRSGKELSDADKPAGYATTALSPDGLRLAMDILDDSSNKRDIWIRDLARGVTSRFTFDGANETAPVWSPDGRRLVFSSDRGDGVLNLYLKDASGTGAEKEIWSCGELLAASDWSPDGKFIAVNRFSRKTALDVWILPTDGTTKPFPFVVGPFTEGLPSFSRDGRYIAYMSNETGRFEIYVQQFPGPGGKWQVSAAGGIEPHWSADGKAIYFRSLDRKIMAASVDTSSTFSAAVPQPLFEARFQPGNYRNSFAVTSDGQRFLLLERGGKEGVAPMTVVLNWPATLRK